MVMGLGRFGGGVDAAKFACKAGSRVIVTDTASATDLHDSICQLDNYNDIEFVFGLHDFSYFQQADVIIVNPAVPDDNKYVTYCRQNNKFVTSQINLFFEMTSATIVGITGSNGKSTTTALTYHLLEKADKNKRKYNNVWLGGNIGNQPLLSIIDQIGPDDIVVLELSSFQAEALAKIKKAPNVMILTNLTPNHLDRHGTFEEYCAAKENLFKYQVLNEIQPSVSIFCSHDPVACQWFDKYKTQQGRISYKVGINDVPDQIKSQYPLPGNGNLCNLSEAMAVARYFGIDDQQIMKNVSSFKALPDRLELVDKKRGVRWYNDSIATTPQSVIEALNAFKEPKVLIAGGYDKHIDFDELGREIAQKAKAAILIGQCRQQIADAISKHSSSKSSAKIQIVESLADAVTTAEKMTENGDVVLLSPACASYDMFINYQDRGRQFAKLVKQLNG